MEFPDVGKHCSNPNCHKLDFLPIKCDVCLEVFCEDHYAYTKHNCSKAYQKDNQVPVCPLCNKPVPVAFGQEPNFVVGAHIDNDCQSDPAKNKRKVFTNKCSMKGCKVREVIPVLCNDCTMNFCLKHRHPQDHHCGGKQGATRQKTMKAALARKDKPTTNQISNGNISEDEALARALELSMQDTNINQHDLDLALARQLQASEYNATTAATRPSNRDRCTVV